MALNTHVPEPHCPRPQGLHVYEQPCGMHWVAHECLNLQDNASCCPSEATSEYVPLRTSSANLQPMPDEVSGSPHRHVSSELTAETRHSSGHPAEVSGCPKGRI